MQHPDESVSYLIVHADDIGSCRASLEALEILAQHKKITSCSVQMSGPLVIEAVRLIAQLGLDAGVHITLNSEVEGLRCASLSKAHSLHDPEGYMWATREALLKHAQTADVCEEITEQLRLAEELGLSVSHVDTHMGAHFLRQEWLEWVIQSSKTRGLAPMLLRPGPCCDEVCESMGLDSEMVKKVASSAEDQGFMLLDSLKTHSVGEDWMKEVLTYIESLGPGIHQLIVHPKVPDQGAQTKSMAEFVMLTDGCLERLVQKRGIKLISWKDLQGWLRC
jgi:chitin disaccharide deacetylase